MAIKSLSFHFFSIDFIAFNVYVFQSCQEGCHACQMFNLRDNGSFDSFSLL